MRLWLTTFLLAFVALCLCGCYPEERFWWSPQGDRALVLVSGKLHVVQANSPELGAPIMDAPAGEKVQVRSANWLPDGTAIICERVRSIPGWAETRALIPQVEAEAVEKMAPTVLALLEATASLSQDRETLDQTLGSLPSSLRNRFGNALRQAFLQDPAGVERRLLALPDGRKIVNSFKAEDAGFEVSEVCLVKPGANHEPTVTPLSRSLLHPALLPRVSPKGAALAVLLAEDDGETATLDVISLDGRSRLTVARGVSGAFDWTPDGRSLVFTSPLGGRDEKLQAIHRITVMQENGALMEPRSEASNSGSGPAGFDSKQLAEPVTLATGFMVNRPTVCCLTDGRVLFASQPLTLPASKSALQVQPRLFVINTNGSIQPVPTGPGDLPTNLGHFAASPDGKRVAVVESETDAVAVVEIDTGKTQIVSPPHPHWQCRTIPAWRSATELTFAALHGTPSAPAWLLWSKEGGIQNLSEGWPASATEPWLEFKAPKADPPSPNPEASATQ